MKQASLAIRSDASRFYDRLGREASPWNKSGAALDRSAFWLNLGYWETARNFPDACAALARRLGSAADLRATDVVLNVGFGYGDESFYWVDNFRIARLVGINITPLHVDIARRRVMQRQLTNRIHLNLGTATHLPYTENSFDKVLSLECALHFRTRELFFTEAFRVLRRGGTLALADGLPLPGQKWSGLTRALRRRIAAVPAENMYDRFTYADKLRAIGYEKVSVTSIREHVYPGFAKCLRVSREHGLDLTSAVIELGEEEIQDCRGFELWEREFGLSDYVIAIATKP